LPNRPTTGEHIRLREHFEDKTFDIEHALNMYASRYVIMRATELYEADFLERLEDQIKNCHIYLIGQVPELRFAGARQDGADLITTFEALGKTCDLRWPMLPGTRLEADETGCYVVDGQGQKLFPSEKLISSRLMSQGWLDFEVLYIGQAYGDDGSRNAVDRLKRHETLQKIAVQGARPGWMLNVLMLEVVQANRLVTMINPFAKNKTQGKERIAKGLEKLRTTTEAERTTLYEASLIRYFQPRFNKEFKNSFPSTNMKLLADCYDKDIAAIAAEISLDDFSLRLFTAVVPPKIDHMAHHDLHDDEARRVFFTARS
jgi:hypothetical protein